MRNLIRGLFAALALSTFACSAQDAEPWKEGKHWAKVRKAETPADAKRIEVQEFFWYGCPHCDQLDPILQGWKKVKPGDVDFVQLPNSLGRPIGITHSKIFYTAQALNVFDTMHSKVFTAIHREHRNIDSAQAAADLFARESGLMPDVFISTFNGFAVDSKVRRAEELAQKYAVSSVPTVVVGGAYYTQASMAGSYEKLVMVINFLVDKVRKERAGK